MQVIGISLLALHLKGSHALNLGTVSIAQAVAFGVFSLLGGTLTDRFHPRRVLLVTQFIAPLLALGFGLLLVHQQGTLLMLATFAFLSAMVASVDGPARAALLPDLVADDLVMKAGALMTLSVNVSSTLGPLMAGWIAGHLGLPAVFFLNATSFFGVIVVLLVYVKDSNPPQPTHRPAAWAAILEGLSVVRQDLLLRSALLSYGIARFFVYLVRAARE